MPGDISLPESLAGSLARGRFTYFPVVPGRLEFAIEVREAILRERPRVVALELPTTLQHAFLRAIDRLPEMSVIFYQDDRDSSERPHLEDAYPDPYSIRHIGLEKYVEAYRVYPQQRSDEIAAHAAGIAWKLQG